MSDTITQHVVVIPYPAQGHVNPLMLFSHKLAQLDGFKITFLNTDFNHKRVLSALALADDDDDDGHNSSTSSRGATLIGPKKNISLVSIPDGLDPDDDRTDIALLCEAVLDNMPAKLEELLRNINALDNKVTCVIADSSMAWAMEVASRMGTRGAVFWPAAAAIFVLELNITRLVDEGLIDSDGFFTNKEQKIYLSSEGLPGLDESSIPWSCIGDLNSQKSIFHFVTKCTEYSKLADWWLSNTAYDVEPAALSLAPKLLPIGPLLESQGHGDSEAQFWAQDHSCLTWLDSQLPCSVIYVAFGSLAVHDETQLNELALGLELTGRPFLWVIRPGMSKLQKDEYPRGKMLSWVPQQKVLSHPSIACFVSHCGWNSTLEGLSNGVPFVCWPYFADQLFNMRYICDIWRVGLSFEPDEDGVVLGEEVRRKVEQVLGDENIRTRALELKEMARENIAEGGPSSKNFNDFVEWLNA
ncbi:hypothetical protein FNV43_RR14544 [Rhamnella rubrinervis]|uniref:Glycosyltransferase n=1 Tax=Rhamnella rubrinervis TaxID=2594499 RepID=A0A8K0H351_9ROSA|nr:hypothetical protein FNV43_RR14544 [Rhamnella rubrinervis]